MKQDISYRLKFILLTILLFILTNNILASLTITNPNRKSVVTKLEVAYFDNAPYFCLEDYISKNHFRTYSRTELGKKVIYFKREHIKITGNSPFITIGPDVYKMTHSTIIVQNKLYVPLYSFLAILEQEIFPRLKFKFKPEDSQKRIVAKGKKRNLPSLTEKILNNSPQDYDGSPAYLKSISYDEKKNGLEIRIDLRGASKSDNLSGFFRNKEWFYLTVYNSKGNEDLLSQQDPTQSIEKVDAINKAQSTLLGFKLAHKFVDKDMYYDQNTGEIVVSLFSPINEQIVTQIEQKWSIDTIVLDPGHGGKDPGAVNNKFDVQEKDLVLDLAQKIGNLIETNTNIEVIYTRKSDQFVPLWKRTEIANKTGGDLFLSLHINACNTPRVQGTEIFLLRPGKAKDAIRVAKKENSVIKYESDSAQKKYKNYKDNILANMIHTANMKDSEMLAQYLNHNYKTELSQKSRGVKQAGFIVLIGASMPKLLLELGYLTNREDAYKLKKEWYRKKLAHTTFESILKYKKRAENNM